MDPRKLIYTPRPQQQSPFYLWDPSRTRFTPTPAQPLPLHVKLDEIRNDLLEELEDDDHVPQKKKHGTLEYFLGGKYDMEEMLKDMQLGQQMLQNSQDDCGLRSNLKKMESCHLSKRLEPLDARQMKAFQLAEQPEGTSIFCPKLVEVLEEDKQKKLEKEERKKKRKEEKAKENLKPTPTSSQLSVASSGKAVKSPMVVVAPPLKLTIGTSFQHHPASSLASHKKSFAAALKGLRALRGRGRGRGRPPGRPLGTVAAGKVGRGRGKVGRGRPRKIPGVTGKRPLVLKLKLLPSPPKETVSSSPPPPLIVDTEEISIKKLDGLKMTMKLGSSYFGNASPSSNGGGEGRSPRTSRPATPKIADEPSNAQEPLIARLPLPKLRINLRERRCEQAEEKKDHEEDDESLLDLY